MEKILKIKETDFDNFTGFQILTDLQTISIGISNEQQCCENFGCIITNDEIDEFLNSELIEISITDTVLNNKKIKELESKINKLIIRIDTLEELINKDGE